MKERPFSIKYVYHDRGGKEMVVWFSISARETMVAHCKAFYPLEACGILIGRREGGKWWVVRSVPVPNTETERAHDRFKISPRDYLRVEKEAQKDGLSVIGFFHSHPDVPPYPSPMDAQFAWEEFLMVIVGVFKGEKVRVRAHLPRGGQKGFQELPVYTLLQSPLLSPFPEEPEVATLIEARGEPEPFVTLSVKEALGRNKSGSIFLVRFDHALALQTLPRALEAEGHTPLLLRWNEEGFWELFIRSR